jgi:uncharacterized protein (DUF1501 family)
MTTPNANPENAYTRRAFLHRGLTIVSTASTVPFFLQRSAFGMNNPLNQMLMMSSITGVPQERVLVVVQLGGGNDGLNTVVPYGDDLYYKGRPGLAIRENSVLKIKEEDGYGFHPALTGFKELHDEGWLTTIHGVGYPNPNRSHFTSMDIWHTADSKRPNGSGWLGRYFDATCNGSPESHSSIVLGREAPRALMGDLTRPVSFETPDLFRWMGEDLDESLVEPYHESNRAGVLSGVDPDSQLGFLTKTSLDAQLASDEIIGAIGNQTGAEYPRNRLAMQLRMVSAMIKAELPTRVYYVNLGGFDTHAGQPGTHNNLLSQLGSSMLAFYRDLEEQGNAERVLTMTFSEFGRRVAQNASNGTDHGTAAPMFLAGPMVRPGMLGVHPSLSELDGGDLKFTLDFRCVYAGVLKDWLGTDPRKVLDKNYRVANVITNKMKA